MLCLNLTVANNLKALVDLGLRARRAPRHRESAHGRIASPLRSPNRCWHFNLGWQRGFVLNRISEERADASVALVKAGLGMRAAPSETKLNNSWEKRLKSWPLPRS